MTTLHLSEVRASSEPIIVRKRPMDRIPVITTLTDPVPLKGVNIFSLARVICKRASKERLPTKLAA